MKAVLSAREQLFARPDHDRLDWACGIAAMLTTGPGFASPALLDHLDALKDADGPQPSALQICQAVMTLSDPQARDRQRRSLLRHVTVLESLSRLGTTQAVTAWLPGPVAGANPLQRWTVRQHGERRQLLDVPTVLVRGFASRTGVLIAVDDVPDELADVALGVWAPFEDGPLHDFHLAVTAAEMLQRPRTRWTPAR